MSVVSAYDACPPHAPFFGYLGCVFCLVLGNIGAAMGTYKAAVGIFSMAVKCPEGIVKNMISVIMSGVVSIYCLIVALGKSPSNDAREARRSQDPKLTPQPLPSQTPVALTNKLLTTHSNSQTNTTTQQHTAHPLSPVISSNITPPTEQGYSTYSLFSAFAALSAGLCCGFCGLASGWATGVVGDVGARAYGARYASNQCRGRYGRSSGGGEGDAAKLFVGSVTVMSFAGATALYGFIMGLIMLGATEYKCPTPMMSDD